MATPGSGLPVVILGAHLAALGVLRVLAGHGVECYVADETSNIIVRSRWYRPTEQTLVESADSGSLAAFLESLSIPKAVLIACSDQWALAVAGLPAELRERFPASITSRETIEQLVDKDRFRALVERLDIARPRTTLISEPGDLDRVTDAELASGFLKPTESHVHNRRFGTKGFFVADRAEATLRVEEARGAGITFMLQDWIPGGLGNTVIIDGFVDQDGTIVAMGARRRVRMEPPRIANTCLDVTIPLADVDGALPAVRTLLTEIGYRGIFMVEFKRDDRDGAYKIIEVNPRPFWLISHVVRAGLDLPWMSYLDAQGLPVPAPPPFQAGRYGMYEILDATAIARAWRARRRPEGPVLKPWLRGDRCLFWWRDPLPAGAAVWQSIGRRLDRSRGRLRRTAAPQP